MPPSLYRLKMGWMHSHSTFCACMPFEQTLSKNGNVDGMCKWGFRTLFRQQILSVDVPFDFSYFTNTSLSNILHIRLALFLRNFKKIFLKLCWNNLIDLYSNCFSLSLLSRKSIQSYLYRALLCDDDFVDTTKMATSITCHWGGTQNNKASCLITMLRGISAPTTLDLVRYVSSS